MASCKLVIEEIVFEVARKVGLGPGGSEVFIRFSSSGKAIEEIIKQEHILVLVQVILHIMLDKNAF